MSGSFNHVLVLGSLLSFGAAGFADEPEREAVHPRLEIIVRVCNYARIPAATLERGQARAGQIFNHAGIEAVWIACPAGDGDTGDYSACRRAFGPGDLIVSILAGTPASYAPHMGYAILPQDGSFPQIAIICFDCMEEETSEKFYGSQKRPGMAISVTLGAVVTHELGHLLLDSHSHSKTGIMKASWTRQDLNDVRFTPGQVNRLRANVRARMEAAQSESR